MDERRAEHREGRHDHRRHACGERKWTYERTSSIGLLNNRLDEAQARRWTVVDMKADWKRVFPFEKE